MADSDPILDHLMRIDTSKPNFKRFKCPGIDNDHLYKPEYVHSNRKVSCRKCGCDPKQRVNRCSDDSDDEFKEIDPSKNVFVHEGTIASGEWVMKNGLQRDEWADKDDILCFEMEAAGALADFPCLIIRGISDYADSHKNDRWHGFAAAVAAAYARELFFHMPVAEVRKLGMTEADVKIMVTETKSLVQSKLDSDIKAWLSPPDPSTNYNAASAKHLDGTGSWLINSEDFVSWRTTPGPSALWLYGSPGCGKTILTYAVLQELRKLVDCSIPKSTILYYFFDFNDVEKQSPDNLVRSLIFQLSRQCDKAESYLTNLYQKHERDDSRPSVQSLCTTFQAMLNKTVEPLIILDALDECKARNDTPSFGGQRLLEWLGHLPCKLLVTSRREADIQLSIDRWRTKITLAIQEGSVNEDIRAYVHQYLQSPHTNTLAETWQSEQAILDEIETKIVEKAGGMFRWVACQLDALAEYDRQDQLRAALQSLPETLAETYRQILQRIPKIHHEDTARLLQFVVYAKRPLTVKEAADALAVTLQHEQPFKEENRPRQILKYCSNLATISDGGKIRLAHFSVKEYLVSDHQDKGPYTKFLCKFEAEESITDVILAYLSCLTGIFDPSSDRHDWTPDWIRDKYPFAGYCAKHWMDHARVAEQSNEGIRDKIFAFISCPEEMPYIHCFRLFDPDQQWDDYPFPRFLGSPLYLASLTGLRYTVERLIAGGADVNENCQGTCHGYPLPAACARNHLQVLKVLLDNGANANLSGGYLHNTALMLALSEGFDQAAHLLLGSGADPHMKGNYWNDYGDWVKAYPLHAAAYNGRKELVELLLQKGADIDNDYGEGTALSLAVDEQHEDVSRLLLDNGADPNLEIKCFDPYSKDWIKTYPLHTAASNGWKGLVEMLLKKGADIHTEDDWDNTALSHASGDGNEDVVRLLLQSGAVINETSLVWASSREHKEVVRTLLDQLSPNEPPDIFCGKALSATAADTTNGQEIIELLLNRGADINAFDVDGRTALEHAVTMDTESGALFLVNKDATLFRMINADSSADIWYCAHQASPASNIERLFWASCYRGWTDLIGLLLKRYANAQFLQGFRDNGLQIASYRGFDSLVGFLLSNGANFHAEPGEFGDALQAASIRGHLSIVRRLLTQGANPNCMDQHGWSAYVIALKHNHEDVCEELSHNSTIATVVQSDTSSRCLPPSTFTAYERASNIIINSDECLVEVGDHDGSQQLIRADHPFPATKRKIYFQIKVLRIGSPWCLAVGVCRDEHQPAPWRFQNIWAMSCDGTFRDAQTTDRGYSSKIDVNDVVGCCVDYDADQLFFTRNGKYLGRASKAPMERLFAAITLAKGARVAFDFGASCPVAIPCRSEKDAQ